ncbi:hypothetical protein [Pendulispora albinea]|uniref:Uncharacterized protein n=1 Tax=Pendulispora albinea TaxID=2741071 RepID=A0ABZ2MAS0_9BACT
MGNVDQDAPDRSATEAFKQVKAIPKGVHLGGSPQLTSLDLSSIETIGWQFELYNLPALRSLEGLRGLTRVEGDSMTIWGDSGFANLQGLEHLTTVKAQLRISGGISELRGLDNLTTVGPLYVGDTTNLRSLRGLDKLARIEGKSGFSTSTEIRNNAALTEIGSLNALTYIETALDISNNPKLTHLAGLHGLTSARYIYLKANPALTRLDGLDALAESTSSIYIAGNNALTTLEDLRALTRVNYDFTIAESSLTNLGMTALTSVGTFTVKDCAALPNLDGLEALRSVGLDLFIENNASLTRTDGLSHLTSVGTGYYLGHFNVRKNPALPECQPAAIVATLRANGYKGTVDISANGGAGTCN